MEEFLAHVECFRYYSKVEIIIIGDFNSNSSGSLGAALDTTEGSF